MVAGSKKSRTLRRVFVKTPGNRIVKHFVKKKPNKAHCATCGGILQGVPQARPSKMQNMPKSQKRPERAFGGVLCSKCLKLKLKEQARQ